MRATVAVLVGVLAAALGARAAEDKTPPPSKDPNLPIRLEEIRRMVLEERKRAEEEAARHRPAAAAAEASAAKAGRLQLGSYGRATSFREFEAFLMTPEGPRFETYVEVYGRTPQEAIDEILRSADLLHGPAPRQSSPTIG